MTRPAAPPEAALIAVSRKASGLTVAKAAAAAGISVARWSQVENGYETRAGVTRPVRAKPETVARMAHAVGVSSERMAKEGERPDVLPILQEIERGEATQEPPPADTPAYAQREAAAMNAAIIGTIPAIRAQIDMARARYGPDATAEQMFPGEPRLALLWRQISLPEEELLPYLALARVTATAKAMGFQDIAAFMEATGARQ